MSKKNVINKDSKYWASPKSRSLGILSDIKIFYDALKLAGSKKSFNKSDLKEELSKRVNGLVYLKEISETATDNLIRELREFEWITHEFPQRENNESFILEPEGKNVVDLYQSNERKFLHVLIEEMYKLYIIPGWFVDRLWRLNPKGQGQIIIPAPLKDWKPEMKKWENNKWNNELNRQTVRVFQHIENVSPNAFPIFQSIWIDEVQSKWEGLGNVKRKRKGGKNEKVQNYSPRRRLAWAMRDATVDLLFSNERNDGENKIQDFKSSKSPLPPRIYTAWCPKLMELELIYYSDHHPKISGRLIFPVSTFKKISESKDFEVIDKIKNLEEEFLHIHKPYWETFKKKFIQTLFSEYQKTFFRHKSLYVSIEDVRDEVCRQLRISSNTFEEYLSKVILLSNKKHFKYNISVETDIREDQKSPHQRVRKSVILNGIPHSLIAMTEKRNT